MDIRAKPLIFSILILAIYLSECIYFLAPVQSHQWLLLAFGFLPKILRGGRGRMNSTTDGFTVCDSTLSFFECKFNGGNTMRWKGHLDFI